MDRQLQLIFPDSSHCLVRFGDESAGPFVFSSPLSAKDHDDLRWYLETYAPQPLGDPDDAQAARVAARLAELGRALFQSVFDERAARALFDKFRGSNGKQAGLLSIVTSAAPVLRLPWELLHETGKGGTYLFASVPRVRIRRHLGTEIVVPRTKPPPAQTDLRVLFVISRPIDASFLDPRGDCAATMDALDAAAPGKSSWEFLYPPTLDALTARLMDKQRPAINVLHFDGHGVFSPERETGYLLFERTTGRPSEPASDYVSAEKFATALERAPALALIVLSACQSATHTDTGEPRGSVASRLAATGRMTVVAMTHSVLVATTRQMFEAFYRHVARGETVGSALDAARSRLYSNPKRYKTTRYDAEPGSEQSWLELHDWFVPTLYQTGPDIALLTRAGDLSRQRRLPARKPSSNLRPAPAGGFFGRGFELWMLERELIGTTSGIALVGFGGLGKTALAEEAGRWLWRTGRFDAVVFMDFSQLQVLDAATLAIQHIGKMLGRSLEDSDAVVMALAEIPTLVILDNVESLAAEALAALLRLAERCSAVGRSRTLLTARRSAMVRQRSIELEGLQPNDALDWFAALMRRPPRPCVPTPDREALLALFARVRFHPLSILVLARELKERSPAELGARLELLLESAGSATGATTDDSLPELVASVQLSLERLTPEARRAVRSFGVFHGGAFERSLLAVTGLGETSARRKDIEAIFAGLERGETAAVEAFRRLTNKEDSPEQTPEELLAEVEWVRELWKPLPQPIADRSFWPALLAQLEDAALIRVEHVRHFTRERFLEFHPTLAPLMWQQLQPGMRAELSLAHRNQYWEVLLLISHLDHFGPQASNEVFMRELPNLLAAVQTALETGAKFAEHMARHIAEFLARYGLQRDFDQLIDRVDASEPDSMDTIANDLHHARHLEGHGRLYEAMSVYMGLLSNKTDPTTPSAAVRTMFGMGRCLITLGWFRYATLALQDAESMAAASASEQDGERLQCQIRVERAHFAAMRGDDVAAKRDYLAAQEMFGRVGDAHLQLRILSELADLERRAGEFESALQRFEKARGLAELTKTPAALARAQLGIGEVYLDLRRWEDAEQYLRDAAVTFHSNSREGELPAVWTALAVACSGAGRLEAALGWGRKAIAQLASEGSQHELCIAVRDLGRVLLTFPDRHREARQLIRPAVVALRQWREVTYLDWRVYSVMARLTLRQTRHAVATTHRRRLIAVARCYSRRAVAFKRIASRRATSFDPSHSRGPPPE